MNNLQTTRITEETGMEETITEKQTGKQVKRIEEMEVRNKTKTGKEDKKTEVKEMANNRKGTKTINKTMNNDLDNNEYPWTWNEILKDKEIQTQYLRQKEAN